MIRENGAIRGRSRVGISCGLGAKMSGVIVVMRRTLLSCTSIARRGFVGLTTTTLAIVFQGDGAAPAADPASLQTIDGLADLSGQEIAMLAIALALLGFSVLSAILLVRTRIRSARK